MVSLCLLIISLASRRLVDYRMRTVFESVPDTHITQIALWTAYRAEFEPLANLKLTATLLPAGEIIKMTTEAFPDAMPTVVEQPNGEKKFVIAGMRIRDRTGELGTLSLVSRADLRYRQMSDPPTSAAGRAAPLLSAPTPPPRSTRIFTTRISLSIHLPLPVPGPAAPTLLPPPLHPPSSPTCLSTRAPTSRPIGHHQATAPLPRPSLPSTASFSIHRPRPSINATTLKWTNRTK